MRQPGQEGGGGTTPLQCSHCPQGSGVSRSPKAWPGLGGPGGRHCWIMEQDLCPPAFPAGLHPSADPLPWPCIQSHTGGQLAMCVGPGTWGSSQLGVPGSSWPPQNSTPYLVHVIQGSAAPHLGVRDTVVEVWGWACAMWDTDPCVFLGFPSKQAVAGGEEVPGPAPQPLP